MSKFFISFFFFKKKIIIDNVLKVKGSFLFIPFFFKNINFSLSLPDFVFTNISKSSYFFKKFLKQNSKIKYKYADKRGSVKFFIFKVSLKKNFFGFFLFNFFFFIQNFLSITGVKLKINQNKNSTFSVVFNDFLFIKKFLNLQLDFFDFFFKVVIIFNFFSLRTITFNLKIFFKELKNWNIFFTF